MGWNELHDLAIKNEAAEIKDSVLLRGTIVRERAELSGMMPIHKACMYGRLAAFQELQELGMQRIVCIIRLNLNINSFWSAPQFKPLFISGADVKCETNWGSNCLHWVVKG
jgi:ankyrin repeat protein